VKFGCLQQLTSDSMSSLLRLAVQSHESSCLRQLLKLHGASACLKTEQVVQLLQASVWRDDQRMVGLLCGMQSAQLLQPQPLAALLTAAVQKGTFLQSVVQLCRLSAAQHLPVECVYVLYVEGLMTAAHSALQELRRSVGQRGAGGVKGCAENVCFAVANETESGIAPHGHSNSELSPWQAAQEAVAAAEAAAAIAGAATVFAPCAELAARVMSALQELHVAACKRCNGKQVLFKPLLILIMSHHGNGTEPLMLAMAAQAPLLFAASRAPLPELLF
jgi:hypothetical protein